MLTNSTNFKKYVEDTMSLVKTFIIKNENIALTMNRYLEMLGYVISEDKTTWRYYLHLSGQYHFADEIMYVTSLDTKETIEFNVENINLHPFTKKFYKPHTENFKLLVSKYPKQELLIRGILNPTDINVAIESNDYTILNYEKDIVEPQETNLIPNLQKRIYKFGIRWNVPGYGVTDELYLASHIAIMYLYIPNWIMALRLENAKTYYAHSFHIKEYLKSNGKLDRFFRFMTLKQKLFLYRNILYIQRNAGKIETFEWLIEKILTDRQIDLNTYDLELNNEFLKESGHKDLTFVRSLFKTKEERLEHTFKQTLAKERPLAYANLEIESETIDKYSYPITHSVKDLYQTKLLESRIIDYSNGGPILFSDMLLKFWGYWSITGKYDSRFKFINPKNGHEIDLDSREAFALFLYCFNRSLGIELTTIPSGRFESVTREELPSISEFNSIVVDKRLVSKLTAYAFDREKVTKTIPFNYTLVNEVRKIYDQVYKDRALIATLESASQRGYGEKILSTFYQDRQYALLDTHDTFNNWLTYKSIDFEGVSDFTLGSLAKEILDECTGLDYYREITISGIHNAMATMFAELSSYNIQLDHYTSENYIPYWDRIDIRVDEVGGKNKDLVRYKVYDSIVENIRYRYKNLLYTNTSKPEIKIVSEKVNKNKYTFESNIDLKVKTNLTEKVRLSLPKVRVNNLIEV